MIPTAQETSEESLKRENPAEGWEEGEHRGAPDPEEPAETMDSVTDRHVAPTSPQESDPETPASLPRLHDPSPPSGVTGTCPMIHDDTNVPETSLNTDSPPVSESHEAAPTSVKKKDSSTDISRNDRKKKRESSTNRSSSERKKKRDSSTDQSHREIKKKREPSTDQSHREIKKKREPSTDQSHREIKRAPPTNPKNVKKQNNNVWVFLHIKNKNEVSTINISNENILECIKENYICNTKEKQEETLSTTKVLFLKMIENNTLIKNKFKELMDNKDRQQAIAVLKRTNNEIEVIGPFKSQRKKGIHSEDIIIDKMNTFVKENNGVSEIWIYTVNSPCLGRINHTPCMYDLIQFSQKHEHIKFYIGFSKYYFFIKNLHNFIQGLEDSAQKCKDVNQTGSETLEELQSTQSEEMETCEEDSEKIKPANSQCSGLKLEDFSRNVVLNCLQDIEDLCTNLVFVIVDEELLECLNFANEE